MNINSAEENKNRVIATTISISSICILLFTFILYSIKTPSKPLDTGSIEVSGFDLSQALTSMAQEKSGNEALQIQNASSKLTSAKNTEAAIQKTEAQLLTEKFIAGNGKFVGSNETQQGGTDGLSKEPTGYKGTGDETTGSIPGVGIDLSGRRVISNPEISKDTKEQGKVVVEITVDHNGTVINAEPNGRGTTTSSATLKEKAKWAALNTHFNSSVMQEQKGTITIIFSF
ncbi:MAG: energy transducer TonB [Bacteroidota bacterium]